MSNLNGLLDLSTLSPKDREKYQKAIHRQVAKRKLSFYKPYPKQIEFHGAGLKFRERLFRAGNQLGKTIAGSAEAAIHATGAYPPWWNGKRFAKATVGWCSGVTSEITRDSVQRLLLGPVGARGTGFIPDKAIVDVSPARGVADLADTIQVRHVSGEISRIRLKYYEQGREKFQAESLDWAWNDEEPPEDVYNEILTRTNATGGIVWTTFTPLKGMSEVVRRFLRDPSPDRCDINMVIEDAGHISAEQRVRIIASYPPHEREARVRGEPILGSGVVFPVEISSISVDAFKIPDHWKEIGALDFGWDHPTAAVKLAYDADADCVYVTHAYRVKEATPVIHAAALRSWGAKLPFAWPHDGYQHDKGSGKELAQQYKDQSLNMLDIHAQFEDKRGNGLEASVMDMLDRMLTGRFKVFRHLNEWFDECRGYYRKDGKIIKEYDDLISATRYGIMMMRSAVPVKPVAKLVRLPYAGQTSGNAWMGG